MPDSVAVQIADALAAGISAHTFSAPYSAIAAVRKYVPDYETQDLATIKVSVVPGPAETERGSRGSDMFMHQTSVVIGRQTTGANADVDALTNLCEEIMDAIRSEILGVAGLPENARYHSASIQSSFDRDSLTDRRIFLAQIDVTHRVLRGYVAAPTGV